MPCCFLLNESEWTAPSHKHLFSLLLDVGTHTIDYVPYLPIHTTEMCKFSIQPMYSKKTRNRILLDHLQKTLSCIVPYFNTHTPVASTSDPWTIIQFLHANVDGGTMREHTSSTSEHDAIGDRETGHTRNFCSSNRKWTSLKMCFIEKRKLPCGQWCDKDTDSGSHNHLFHMQN